MRRIFAIFAALAFVAVQAVDLALLDAAHAEEAAAHAGAAGEAGGPEPCDGDGDASCAWHCPCHSLHHPYAQAPLAQLPRGTYDAARLSMRHHFAVGMAWRPPVPPPLA